MNALLLIVSVGGSRVAFPAAAVESVVELEALIPVPRAAPHIAGLVCRVLSVHPGLTSFEVKSILAAIAEMPG